MLHSRNLLALLFTAIICLAFAVDSQAKFQCIECHSKRPGARAMHKALRGRDCFTCHVRGEKLRQKGGIPQEKHDAFLKQRLTDPRCTECHGKKEIEVVKEELAKKPVTLSGSTYCPKCEVKGDKDWKMCPKCGGPLIDLHKLMRHSAVNPDHRMCRQCHFMEGELEGLHMAKVGGDFATEQDCLECHEGHNECGGCH